VVQLIRQSVLEAFLPSMSRMAAGGQMRSVMEMNARANAMVGVLLFPLLAFAFAFADDIIAFVYTAAYVEGGAAMRVYILGMAAMVVEIGSVVLLLRDGGFALRVSALALAVSVAVSWTAAHHVGLAGAAAGSVVAIYLDRVFMLRRVAKQTGIRVAELQDWRALCYTLATSVVAAGLAWVLVEKFASGKSVFYQLFLGASVLGTSYLLMNLKATRR